MTYANVAMTLALVFAMSGGAFAAGKYLITSTKQIKPSVLASLKGASGKAGPTGAAGAIGPAGPVGPQGPKGENGTAGTNGQNGQNGESVTNTTLAKGAACKEGGAEFKVGSGVATHACNGEKGKEGSPWTAGGKLPAGQTETGVWSMTTSGSANPTPYGPGPNEVYPRETYVSTPFASISFTIPLEKAFEEGEVHYVGSNGNGGTCPGSVEEPSAEPGNLCVYQGEISGVKQEEQAGVQLAKEIIRKPSPALGASVVGAMVVFEREEAKSGGGSLNAPAYQESASGFGTWAVTEREKS